MSPRPIDVSRFPLAEPTALYHEGERIYELPANLVIEGRDLRDRRSDRAVHAVIRDRLTGKRLATTSPLRWRASSDVFELVWLR